MANFNTNLISEILPLPRDAAGEERGTEPIDEEGDKEPSTVLEDLQAGWTATVQHLLHFLCYPERVPDRPLGH